MNRKSKVVGLLLATLVIGLSSISASRGEPKTESTESIWLVVVGGTRAGWTHTNIATIEMESIDACESQGIRMSSSKDFRQGIFDEINYICIKGK